MLLARRQPHDELFTKKALALKDSREILDQEQVAPAVTVMGHRDVRLRIVVIAEVV
jgi:hypothetical protein